MMFIQRDDNAVTSTSTVNASWAVESLPETCSMDTWVRAAIPEAQQESTPYAMEQFLRLQSPARPGAQLLRTTTSSRRSTPTQQTSREGSPRVGQKTARPAKAQLGPEARAAESRLREELAIRKSQEEKARELEAKDVSDKAKLLDMQRELKGREYTYDHKGQVKKACRDGVNCCLLLGVHVVECMQLGLAAYVPVVAFLLVFNVSNRTGLASSHACTWCA